MKKVLIVCVLSCAVTMFAQNVSQTSTGNNSPNTANVPAPAATSNEIVVKSSPAADELIAQSKKMGLTSKAYNDLYQQARTNLDAKNKPILDEMRAKSKKWQDKMDAENKDLQAQINKNTAEANEAFQKQTAILSANAVSPQTITTLEAIVKREQNLPDTAHFDPIQVKWTDTAKK